MFWTNMFNNTNVSKWFIYRILYFEKKPGMLISHMNKLIYKSQKNVSYSVLSDSLWPHVL